jgi:hypothetical protein
MGRVALMDVKKLIELRKQAEKVVADMPDGELKVKAFEVVFSNLLGQGVSSGTERAQSRKDDDEPEEPQPKKRAKSASSKSVPGRILVLRGEGFFKSQKTLPEVQEELAAHGWHYGQSDLSGPLQALRRRNELRRIRGKKGKKQVWLYSNP